MGCKNSKSVKKMEEVADNTGEQIVDFMEDKVIPMSGEILATVVLNAIFPVIGGIVSKAVIEASKEMIKQ